MDFYKHTVSTVAASNLIFKNGMEKRSARRASKKLHWAKTADREAV
jgi:hypothetical protein